MVIFALLHSQLPDKIRTLRQLKTLKLGGCKFKEFPKVICSFKHLNHLVLDICGRPRINKRGQPLERWLEQEVLNFCAIQPGKIWLLIHRQNRGKPQD